MGRGEENHIFSPALVNTFRAGLSRVRGDINSPVSGDGVATNTALAIAPGAIGPPQIGVPGDRKSTRLNSSHQIISYAVFCLKKKKNKCTTNTDKKFTL